MRTKKAIYNILTSLMLQLVTIICGFIVPRLIISTYGSDINGMIASITQFLGYIVLLEAGLGGVVRAALYKPLADNKDVEISAILSGTEKFFKKIAYVFALYALVLAAFFPSIIGDEFEWWYSAFLVLITGISIFAQYYFGITYSILLQADQKNYISNIIQIGTITINAALTVILILSEFNIHVVKLLSSFIFMLRPILLYIYVSRKYKITTKCLPNYQAINQRWDGLGHHIAFFLHNNSAIVILTIFTNLKEVSVYSIYYMIVVGIEKITSIFSSGLEAAFGNIIAKNEKDILLKTFAIYELLSAGITVTLFTTAGLLIIQFVSIYTSGIFDANYIRPEFAIVIFLAEAIYCIRMPYHSVTLAAGHFKQTRNGAFIEAGLNIILSIILVQFWGIIGVAIGTLVAMTFRTIQYGVYLSKNILQRSVMAFVKRQAINIMNVCIILLVYQILFPNIILQDYLAWAKHAIIVTIISSIITILVNTCFYRQDLNKLVTMIVNIIKKNN